MPTPIARDVYFFPGETNSVLLVRNRRSLLIDCGDADLAARIRAAGLPLPDAILHTQVQEEHCREWAGFPDTPVYVHAASRDVALRAAAYFAACRTRWSESREWEGENKGREIYTLCGCPLERPPLRPLTVAGDLEPGGSFLWQDLSLAIYNMPGSGRHALGFFLPDPSILFSGDLFQAGGFLVNYFDCERSYGGHTGYRELMASLASVIECDPRLAVPTTGPVSNHPRRDARRLIRGLRHLLDFTGDNPGHTPFRPERSFGLFKQICEGLYQNNNAGNLILYIDDQGRGLCIDPDPCIWEDWETSCRIVHEQLDLLEREAGLKRIEWALITHYHGDHLEFSDLLRERYATAIMATADVAELVERPHEFDYPALIPWYGFPFDHVRLDRYLTYEEPLDWHGISITPVHTPGHCGAHAGFLIPWKGMRTACTGDTLQYTAGPIRVPLPIYRSHVVWPDRVILRALERLIAYAPTLVLGAHSHTFADPDGRILQNWHMAATRQEQLAKALIGDRDLTRAMCVPRSSRQ